MQQLDTETFKPQPVCSQAQGARASCIELDRFCEGCGYNLRTLAVRRDTQTGIPVVRCPECGRFQSANDASTTLRPWINRMVNLLLVLWMLTIVAVLLHLGLAEGAISYASLEELTIRGGTVVQRTNNTTTYTWSGRSGPREINTHFEQYKLFVAFVLASSFVTAFVSGLFAVVVLPHWRRAVCAAVVLALPIVAGVVVAVAWHYEAPHLLEWGLRHLTAHACLQLLGAAVGVVFGRPFARLTVRILLPPGVRPRLAYLWLADHKPFPLP